MNKFKIIIKSVLAIILVGAIGFTTYYEYQQYKINETNELFRFMTDDEINEAATDIDYTFIDNNYPEYKEAIKKHKKECVGFLKEVYEITNSYRTEYNVTSYQLDSELCMLASIRAEEMKESKSYSHTRPYNKGYFSTIFNEYGFVEGKAGENIAWGYKTAQDACKALKNSEEHYKNIINSEYTKVGFGISVLDDGTYLVVQELMN